MDWDTFKLDELAADLRGELDGPEAERMVYAFEEALRVARSGADLLPHFLAAITCMLARAEGTTPRDVLETYFRRSTPDEIWRERYLPLFG